jgi:hypothetical protein
MLNARINEAKRQLHSELERGKRVHGGEATLAELTRDYQVNRDIYQDLLKRRENARVSMNLDRDKQGLTIKIQEPPTLPLSPSGLRFLHFVIAAPLLGVILPLGLIYGRLRLDPRIRFGALISEKLKLPLLSAVPHLWTPIETQIIRREFQWMSLAVTGTALIFVVVIALRLMKMV